MTRPFVQTHIFTLYGKPGRQVSRFITLNGLEGSINMHENELTLQTQYAMPT